MAGAGWKSWIAGERVDFDDFQGYLQDQVVSVFASTAARDSAITAPSAGMECNVAGRKYIYDGSNWIVAGWYTTGGRVEARVRRVATQSISNGALTPLSFDTEDVDTDTIHSAGTFTVPSGLAGIWSVTFHAVMATAVSGRFFVSVEVTSSLTGVSASYRQGSTGEDRQSMQWVGPLAAADTFTCDVFQISGGALNATGWADVLRLGA